MSPVTVLFFSHAKSECDASPPLFLLSIVLRQQMMEHNQTEMYAYPYYLTAASYHILPLSHLCSSSTLLSLLVRKETQVGCNDTCVVQVKLLSTCSYKEILNERISSSSSPLPTRPIIALITCSVSAQK